MIIVWDHMVKCMTAERAMSIPIVVIRIQIVAFARMEGMAGGETSYYAECGLFFLRKSEGFMPKNSRKYRENREGELNPTV
jgi:hypothetical protein